MADSVYDVVGAFQDIEMELIKSMQRNMKRHIGEQVQEDIIWTQWQAEMLNGLAQYKAENADKLQGYYSTINEDIEEAIRLAYQTGESEQEIELLKAIQEGFKADKTGIGTNAMQGSFFKVNKDKLNALIKATTEDMSKAENAILRMTDDVYRQTIFKAQMFYNSGASTLWKAVDMATKDFLSAGINCIQYKNGARVNIASYSEMALRTANKRANLMGSANKRMEYGIHTVKITSHNSACPMCIQWQGKVYYDDVYGEVTPAERRGLGDYPLLSNAVKGGMFHPNCKNGLSTYYDGINQPPKEPTKAEIEEMNRRYSLEQRQRECERNIRKYKRLENGSIDAENVAKYTEKRKQWTNEYNKLIAGNADVLRAGPARLKLYGINTKDLKPAIQATTKNITIQSINKNASESLLNAYDDRRKHFNLNMTPADELKKSSLNSVTANYDGVSLETARAFNDTILSLSKEYYTGFTQIKVGDKKEFFGAHMFATTSHNNLVGQKTLILNPHKASDYNKMVDRIKELSEKGYAVKIKGGLEGKYIATHEFAHSLIDLSGNYKNYVGMDAKQMKSIKKEIDTLFEEYKTKVDVLEKAYKKKELELLNASMTADITELNKLQNDVLSAKKSLDAVKLSNYSMENADEFMAEAFTQSKLGDNQSYYSDKVMNILDKYFKKK